MNSNIEDVVLFQIEKTSKIAKAYSQREFDSAGVPLTVDQWVLLKIIDEYGPLSQISLAERSFRDPASIKRSLDLLQKKNFIQKQVNASDRRQSHVYLSKKGGQLIAKHMAMVQRHRDQSTKRIAKKELKTLVSLLQKIQANLA